MTTVVAASDLDLFALLMKLLGGLGVFLFGMDMMSTALKLAAGNRMRAMLGRLTKSPVSGVLTGTVVTGVLQSSSVTTVLTVGFVSAGLMTFAQSVPVIFGSNIGTTTTAQIVSLKVTDYALLLVAAGYPLVLLGRSPRAKGYGHVLAGLGFVFLGMLLMGEGMGPLRTEPGFQSLMVKLRHPLLGLLVGAVFTGLVQSSSATTGIVIALSTQGLITLPTGIALTLGANVGTCSTAMLATIGKSREALRVAVVHVLFNVAGAALWIGFVDQLASLVTWMSPTSPELTGAERLAAETPRQIANAHTVFNVANTLVFLPFTAMIARVVLRLLPDRPAEEVEVARPVHLDESLIGVPALSLAAARQEVRHVGEAVVGMIEAAVPLVLTGDRKELERLRDADRTVDALHAHLIDYLKRASQAPMTPKQTAEDHALFEAANGLEHMADLVETNLVGAGLDRVERGLEVGAETRDRIRVLHGKVREAVRASVDAFVAEDREAARRVVAAKREINRLAADAARHQRRRLASDAPRRVETYTFETEIVESLKRVYYFAKRLARETIAAGDEEPAPTPEWDLQQ